MSIEIIFSNHQTIDETEDDYERIVADVRIAHSGEAPGVIRQAQSSSEIEAWISDDICIRISNIGMITVHNKEEIAFETSVQMLI